MSRKGCPLLESGMALVMVLVFSSTLLLLGAALLTYSFNEKLIADYQEEEARLYYIAEAGLETGLAALRRDFSHRNRITGAINGGSFKVDFTTPGPGKCCIASEGALGYYRKTVTLIAEQDLLAGCESLSADDIYLFEAEVFGDVHVNRQLRAEQGDSLISGDLHYRDGQPPLIALNATLEVAGSSSPAAPLPPAWINFEQLAGRTTRKIPGGLLRQPPAQYPDHSLFFVEGDLDIAPEAGETFDFSGLFYVQGDLSISPAAGSSLLLEGVIAAEGSITLQPHSPFNSADPPRNLILLAGGEINVSPAEDSMLLIGGTQIFYSRSVIRLQGASGGPAALRGVYLSRQLRMENCSLHYEPSLLYSAAGMLPGLGQIRTEWVKP